MKYFRISTIFFLAVAAAFAMSCKKDDGGSSSTKEPLSGTIKYDFPSYVKYGDVIHVEPWGAYKGDDKADSLLAYSWTDPLTGKVDTLRLEGDPAGKGKAFDFVVSADTLGVFSLSVSAWADGYSVKTATASFTVVNPTLGTGSLKGYDFLPSAKTFTDARDGRQYYYNTVAGKDWMVQNLSWDGAGEAYDGSDLMGQIFGRYYTWTEASSACPAGWHLPSSAEFKALAESAGGKEDVAAGSLMVDASFNGSKMWEFWPDVKITNSSRFSAIPVGYATIEGDKPAFKGLYKYAMFWASDSVDSNMAVVRYIYVDKPVLYGGEFGKNSVRASVRCTR